MRRTETVRLGEQVQRAQVEILYDDETLAIERVHATRRGRGQWSGTAILQSDADYTTTLAAAVDLLARVAAKTSDPAQAFLWTQLALRLKPLASAAQPAGPGVR